MHIAFIDPEPILAFACVLLPLMAGGLVLAIIALRQVSELKRRVEGMARRLDSMQATERRAPVDRPATFTPTRPIDPVSWSPPKPAPMPPPPVAPPPIAPKPSPSRPAMVWPPVEPAPAKPSEPLLPPRPAPQPKITKPRRSLEERITTQWMLWVAALALAAAGIFAVKFTYEHAVLSPKWRIILATAFGAILVGAGVAVFKRLARIGEALSAAGVAVLFAAFWAGVRIYPLIPPWIGFVLMAGVTALAVVLSLRQGPLVALLGLVGGFLTPVLVGEGTGRPELLAYLFLIQCGALAVTRKRRWGALVAGTLAATIAWSVVWMRLWYQPDHALWIAMFLTGSSALYIVAAGFGRPDGWGMPWWSTGFSWVGAIFGLIMLGWLVRAGEFSTMEWAFLGLAGVGCMVLGRLRVQYETLAWLAGALTLFLVISWINAVTTESASRFGWTALAFGALYAGGAYVCLWNARSAGRWAMLCAVAGLAYLATAYWTLEHVGKLPMPAWTWGGICAGLAVVYTLAATPVYRRRESLAEGELAVSALIVAITAFVSWIWPIELHDEWLAVAWAIQIPLLAAVDTKLRLPILRIVAAILAVIVLVASFNPFIFTYPIGAHPLWNWLTYGYGVPAICFAIGAWLFLRREDGRIVDLLEGGAITLGWALLTLLVRQWFHPGHLREFDVELNELAAWTNIWLIYGGALLVLTRRIDRRVLLKGALVVITLALAQGIFSQVLIASPLAHPYAIGETLIFNGLLWLYGLPALLAGACAWELWRRRLQSVALPVAITALVFLFVLVTLQVRQGFHGTYIHVPLAGNTEWATFTLAWMLLGLSFMGIGFRWPPVRYVGVAFAAIAVFQAAVTQCFGYNPLIKAEPVGETLILNWLLYWYALPAALCAVAALLLWKLREQSVARFFLIASIAFTLLTVTLEVRQAFHGAYINVPVAGNTEWATFTVAWMLLGLAFIGLSARHPAMRTIGIVIVAVGATQAAVTQALGYNPLIRPEHVGETFILNWLLYWYGLPAALLAIATVMLWRHQALRAARIMLVAAILFTLLTVTLEVRHAFHGPVLNVAGISQAEHLAYSLSWIAMAVILLFLGILTGGLILRWASLVLMGIAIVKVFAFDTKELQDLYRVGSYLCLGLTIIGMAYFYQRFVFRRSSPQTVVDE